MLIPGAPLIPILFLSQALNAVLLLVLLPFMRALGKDRELMGENALGRVDRIVTAVAFALIAASVVALAVLTVPERRISPDGGCKLVRPTHLGRWAVPA